MDDSLIENVLNMLHTGVVINYKETGTTYKNNMEKFENAKFMKGDIYTNDNETEYYQKCTKDTKKYHIETFTVVTNIIKKVDRYGIDYLTKLPIRAKIVEYLDEISKTDDKYILALLDIDNFKSINDTYGHDMGDKVLRELAKVLRSNKNEEDFFGRYGGEEFLLIFKTDNLSKILNKLDLMRKNINSLNFKSNNDKFKISVSIGISQFKPNKDNYNDKIKEADIALYNVKENGKNNIEIFNNNIIIGGKNVNKKINDVN